MCVRNEVSNWELGQRLGANLQDESVGYQTATHIGEHPNRFCTLDAKVSADQQANAFIINQRL